MIPNSKTTEMQNPSLNVPGQISATRLADGKIKLARQFHAGQRTITGAVCVLAPGAAKALAEGIVSLLEE